MPRQARSAPGGLVYHVLNRGVGRMELFSKKEDYLAFERCLREVQEVLPMRLLGYCLMPNHWHLIVWPREDGDLGAFMQRLTLMHARRWQEHRHVHGTGHVYQGRYKSFPVEGDEHYLGVLRYVQRNALRAGKCERAEEWRFGSLWRSREGEGDDQGPILSAGPVDEPSGWLRTVNTEQRAAELARLRLCVNRGQPFGGDRWVKRVTKELGLESTFRERGRPRKDKKGGA